MDSTADTVMDFRKWTLALSDVTRKALRLMPRKSYAEAIRAAFYSASGPKFFVDLS